MSILLCNFSLSQKIKHNDAKSRLHAIFFYVPKQAHFLISVEFNQFFNQDFVKTCWCCCFWSSNASLSFSRAEAAFVSSDFSLQKDKCNCEKSPCLVSVDIQRLNVLLLIFSVYFHFTASRNCLPNCKERLTWKVKRISKISWQAAGDWLQLRLGYQLLFFSLDVVKSG